MLGVVCDIVGSCDHVVRVNVGAELATEFVEGCKNHCFISVVKLLVCQQLLKIVGLSVSKYRPATKCLEKSSILVEDELEIIYYVCDWSH